MSTQLVLARSRWRDIQQVQRAFLPSRISKLLYDEASLTVKVQKYCAKQGNKQFSVTVINQRWQQPSVNERRHLHMRSGLYACIREIYLLCDDKKIVYARSVIPITTITGRQRQIKFLNNRSLGSYLFSDRSLRREITQIAQAQLGGRTVWGRRSVFDVDKKPLFVAEWFLEDNI